MFEIGEALFETIYFTFYDRHFVGTTLMLSMSLVISLCTVKD